MKPVSTSLDTRLGCWNKMTKNYQTESHKWYQNAFGINKIYKMQRKINCSISHLILRNNVGTCSSSNGSYTDRHNMQPHISLSRRKYAARKGIMSTKPVFTTKQRYKGCMSRYCGHLCFWHRHVRGLLLTKITIFCNNVNKTSTSIELLEINILCYMSKRSNVGLVIKSRAGLKTFAEEQNGHNAFVHPLKFDELLQ